MYEDNHLESDYEDMYDYPYDMDDYDDYDEEDESDNEPEEPETDDPDDYIGIATFTSEDAHPCEADNFHNALLSASFGFLI